VKNVFLHEDLLEKVYMEIPLSFGTAQTVGKIYMFTKSLYGLKAKLEKKIEIKELGQFTYFIGIEVARGAKEIVLSHRKYVLDLLTETRMLGCKPVVSLIDMNAKINTDVRE
jgi:hypothetical protein